MCGRRERDDSRNRTAELLIQRPRTYAMVSPIGLPWSIVRRRQPETSSGTVQDSA